MAGAIGRPVDAAAVPPMLIAAPTDMPRLVNLRKRGFAERPWGGDRDWPRRRELSPYDGAAGFLNKWEHRSPLGGRARPGARLCHRLRPRRRARCADGYRVVVLVGHSEYWSARSATRSRFRRSRRQARHLLRQHGLLESPSRERRREIRLPQMAGFRERSARERPSAGRHPSVVAQGVRTARSGDHRAVLSVRRLSPVGPLRRARARRIHRLQRPPLGARRHRPLLWRYDRQRDPVSRL